ncbi:hypothetical protein MHN79_10760 [Vibrio sp. Of14-4]|uniref:hypothetical protein n=1 Tax=Vibrio sp. Of14-4 TaxID=2724878 RepID=UPI001EF3B531|nr:hypothetical protein [Vibrio sp. Of14-4]MCG7489971.1 hypothetical protein [Vibrio sp. Of14-4]
MSKNKAPMIPEAAARVQANQANQANQAKQNGGQVSKDSFAARAQRAAANNQNQGK